MLQCSLLALSLLQSALCPLTPVLYARVLSLAQRVHCVACGGWRAVSTWAQSALQDGHPSIWL